MSVAKNMIEEARKKATEGRELMKGSVFIDLPLDDQKVLEHIRKNLASYRNGSYFAILMFLAVVIAASIYLFFSHDMNIWGFSLLAPCLLIIAMFILFSTIVVAHLPQLSPNLRNILDGWKIVTLSDEAVLMSDLLTGEVNIYPLGGIEWVVFDVDGKDCHAHFLSSSGRQLGKMAFMKSASLGYIQKYFKGRVIIA